MIYIGRQISCQPAEAKMTLRLDAETVFLIPMRATSESWVWQQDCFDRLNGKDHETETKVPQADLVAQLVRILRV
jgi:hypothetical protein